MRSPRPLLLAFVLLPGLALATLVRASPSGEPGSAASGPEEGVGPPARGRTRSRAIGATNRGWLASPARLASGPHLRVRSPRRAHGTLELVDLVRWAGGRVGEVHGGPGLLVGDLAGPRGDRLRPHRSHRTGLDADLGFYLLDAEGEAHATPRFVHLDGEGRGTDREGAEVRFDARRNWALVAALLGQNVTPVQYVMVIAPLKAQLLAEAERVGAPAWLQARARVVVGPQRTGRGRRARRGTHDSHFHVRIYCPRDDLPRCRDKAPYHPWIGPRTPPRRPRRRRRGRAMR
ncbi:MAG: penicillin-insensitive murein endopeptidase [Myxococcota bacterium]